MVLPGDDSKNSPWGADLHLVALAIQALDARANNVEIRPSSAAIVSTIGKVMLTKTSAGAYTLAAPIPGLPAAGGNDGQLLNIICITAFAHTVTTPANKINGNKTTITFAAAAGNNVQLEAYQGVWYVTNGLGQTLS
jgi:hypothetical protein